MVVMTQNASGEQDLELRCRLRMIATERWLVMTVRLWWSSSASAMASMVVPMSMNTVAPSGMWAATALAMRFFSAAKRTFRFS